MQTINREYRNKTFKEAAFSWFRRTLPFVLAILTVVNHPFSYAQDNHREVVLLLHDDTEVILSVFPAKGRQLLIWIPSYATPLDTVTTLARQLQRAGIELWYADLLEARFLPKTASSVYKIPGTDIGQLLDHAHQTSDKKVYVYAESRATIPVLQGIREWQLANGPNVSFGGLVLNSPYFYIETPDPGETAQLRPVVGVTNLPIYILQPEYSPRYWQLRETVPVLEQSGSDVYVQVLKNLRGRFHFRPDATAEETRFTTQFGRMLAQSLRFLDTINQRPRVAKAKKLENIPVKEGKKDRNLQSYQGNPAPPPLQLPTLSGETMKLQDLKNQVVLVNFWATWCPPCVHEMPSMQRLSEKLLNEPFVILGVNIAEPKSAVETFLQNKINVDFPILLDSDGRVMRQWNVMAFPTSFIIDKRGDIRYALFGSIDWNTPDIMNKIQLLLKEK